VPPLRGAFGALLRQLDEDQDERGEPGGRQAAHEQHERP
jgi:hypothetical protein